MLRRSEVKEVEVGLILSGKDYIMVGVEGLEPPAVGLEIRCSIQLSYTPASFGHDSGALGRKSNATSAAPLGAEGSERELG
jgi:hypothetical protein